ncbi:MAG: hypothetical protein ABUS56_04200 [Acidobacteriota bacterium]|jgi:hypothetical protein
MKKTAPKRTRKASKKAPVRAKAAKRVDPLLARVKGAVHRKVGHVGLDVGPAGAGRVKRLVYPVGFHWLKDMKKAVGTDLCMHAHVGFIVRGEIHIEYADGCVEEFKAPQVVAIAPGHDGWVVGREPVVMIEFDFEGDTISRFGMPTSHQH